MRDSELETLEARLGHRFASRQWLERALTHRSHSAEADAAQQDNERLEFLGDAVLTLLASEFLIDRFPDWTEGQLSKGRARLVNAASLAAAARRLELGRFLRLGRGEEKTGGREKPTLLADAFEALIAAVYLDAGLAAAAEVARRALFEPALHEQPELLSRSDDKSALQEWLQARGRAPAEYCVVAESGPDHCKTFTVEVRIEGESVAVARGGSKKEAELAAAQQALDRLLGSEERKP
ncbi:MAG: ribonuclease III [Acidobacteriia bacterium]|jgi:ribonuclease-3|nr:ribonuclease III [Terriglobia bacterium]